MTKEEYVKLLVEINSSFSPSAPINNTDLFAGRSEQISSVRVPKILTP